MAQVATALRVWHGVSLCQKSRSYLLNTTQKTEGHPIAVFSFLDYPVACRTPGSRSLWHREGKKVDNLRADLT